jgi:MFS transporter, DHA1 family, multidrug resistance protein
LSELSQWRRNQFAVTVVTFVGFTGFTLVMPFLALYVQELGVTDTGDVALWTGLALGATPAITALCSPFWGRIADKYGNKLLVQRSLLSFLLVMAAMSYVTEAWHLFALRALQGFVAGYGVLLLSMAAQSAPRDRMAHAIGAVQTAQRMGPAIGPVIGGALAPAVGLRNSFLVSSGVYAVALVILSVLYREPRRQARPESQEQGRVTFGNILAFENFLLLMVVIFGLQIVDRSFGPILPLYLGELGYPSRQIPIVAGVLFSVLAVSGALGHQLAATLLKRMSARAVIASATLAGAAALGVFALGSSLWSLVPAMSGVGLALGTASTAAFAAAGSVIPPHVHATSFGFLTSASLVGSAISPMVSGFVGARSGSWR